MAVEKGGEQCLSALGTCGCVCFRDFFFGGVGADESAIADGSAASGTRRVS